MGWVIFIMGLIALVLGAYAKIGYWVCLVIAVSWYISLHQSSLRTKRKRELLTRLKGIEEGPWPN
jgi:hypothetical protein